MFAHIFGKTQEWNHPIDSRQSPHSNCQFGTENWPETDFERFHAYFGRVFEEKPAHFEIEFIGSVGYIGEKLLSFDHW